MRRDLFRAQQQNQQLWPMAPENVQMQCPDTTQHLYHSPVSTLEQKRLPNFELLEELVRQRREVQLLRRRSIERALGRYGMTESCTYTTNLCVLYYKYPLYFSQYLLIPNNLCTSLNLGFLQFHRCHVI